MQDIKFHISSVIEMCVYLFIIILVSTGRFDRLFSSIPFLATITMVVLILAFIGVLVLLKQNDTILLKARTLLLLSSLVTAGVHFTATTNGAVYPSSINHVFYYALVLLFALTGSLARFLSVFGIFLVSEFARYVPLISWAANPFNQMPSVVKQGALDTIPHTLLWHCCYVFGLGFIGYLFSWQRIMYMSPLQKLMHKQKSPASDLVPSRNTTKIFIDTAKPDTSLTRFYSKENMEQDTGDSGVVEEELSSVVYFMSRMFNTFSALGFIFDPQKQLFILNSYHSKSIAVVRNVQIPAQEGFFNTLTSDKASFVSGNIADYGHKVRYYSKNEMVYSVLAVPILSSQNELLGALVVDSKDKMAFRDHHKDILNRFSYLAAALITNLRMRKFQEKVAAQFQIFYESAQQFSRAQHTSQVFDILFNMIAQLTPHSRIMAVDFHSDTYLCNVRKVVGTTTEVQEGFSFPLNEGIFASVFKKRQTCIIDNYEEYRQKKLYLFVPEEQLNPDFRSIIIIPFTTSEHFCNGVISVEGPSPNQFSKEAGQLLVTIVSNAAVAYQKAFLYEKMEMLATTDGLTAVYNHRTFQNILAEEITRSIRYKRNMSLLLLDIDHFKSFNDTYGHTTGDLVLREIAKCIRETIRRNDVPARYGGEEFVVIVPETTAQDALIIGERIRQNIAALIIPVNDQQLHVTVSMGCANVPEHASDSQHLINSADAALYFSKENGRNQLNVYNKKMSVKETGV